MQHINSYIVHNGDTVYTVYNYIFTKLKVVYTIFSQVTVSFINCPIFHTNGPIYICPDKLHVYICSVCLNRVIDELISTTKIIQ